MKDIAKTKPFIPKAFESAAHEKAIDEINGAAFLALANYAETTDPTGAQYKEVRAITTRAVKARTSIDKTEKVLRADARVYLKAVGDFAQSLRDRLAGSEASLKLKLETWDAEKAKAKAEKERIQKEKLAAIKATMDYLKEALAWFERQQGTWFQLDSLELLELRDGYDAITTGAEWGEFQVRAVAAKAYMLGQLDLFIERVQEAEEAAASAERALKEAQRLQDEAAAEKSEQARKIKELEDKLEAAKPEPEPEPESKPEPEPESTVQSVRKAAPLQQPAGLAGECDKAIDEMVSSEGHLESFVHSMSDALNNCVTSTAQQVSGDNAETLAAWESEASAMLDRWKAELNF